MCVPSRTSRPLIKQAVPYSFKYVKNDFYPLIAFDCVGKNKTTSSSFEQETLEAET